MQKLKINDEVMVLTGKDRGKSGKVTRINKKKNVVFVEGVNVKKKALKPTQENPNGGFAEIEASINVSNIAVISPKTGKPTRVKIEMQGDKRVRVAVKCGSILS